MRGRKGKQILNIYRLFIILLLAYPFVGTAIDSMTGHIAYKYCVSFPREKGLLDYSDTGSHGTQEINLQGVKSAEQSFCSPFNQIIQINVNLEDHSEKSAEAMKISLVNLDSGSVISEWDIDSGSINESGVLNLPVQQDHSDSWKMVNQEYAIMCTEPGDRKRSDYTLKAYDSDIYPDGTLKIDGKDTGTDLVFSVTGYQKRSFEYVRLWIRILFSGILILVLQFINRKKEHEKRT